MDESLYQINLDAAFGPGQVMDILGLAGRQQPWWNQTLCAVDDCVVRLGVVEGEFHRHKHDDQDEFFFVLEGKWIIEMDDQTVELGPGMGYLVPKGVMHNPRAPVRTVILMVEGSGVVPTGD